MQKNHIGKILALCIVILFIGSSFTSAFLVDSKEKKCDEIIIHNNNITFQNNEIFNHCIYRSISDQNLSFFKNKNPASISNFIKNKIGELPIQSNVGFSIKNTIDNGFIICGYTGNQGCHKGFLIKTDSQGYENWNKTYSIKHDTMFISLEHASDSGYIVTGSTYDGLNNTYIIFLMKTDYQGNKLWQKTYDYLNHTMGIKVRKTNDGGYIITGPIYDSFYNQSVLLIKTDINGEKIWDRTIQFNKCVYWEDVQQTSDGGYIIGGAIGGPWENLMFAFLLKTDEYGNEIWYETYGIMNYTMFSSILQTEDDGFVGVGHTGPYFSQNTNLVIIKTDDTGDEEWNKTYDVSVGYCLEQTSDNGFIIGGRDYDQGENYAILLKTDEYGDEMWHKVYNDLEESQVSDIEVTDNGDYALTGLSRWSSDPNITYVLLLKTDDVGNEQFSRYFNVADINVGYVKFYGWDLSSSCYSVLIKIGYSEFGLSSSSPIEYYETFYHGFCPGSYYYMVSWKGKEGECSVDGIIEINAGEYLDIVQNLTFCDDLPNVSIDKPKNALYINDKHIISFFIPIIIGSLNVDVTASDVLSGVDYVLFYIDGELMLQDYTEPYLFYWSKFSFGKHNLKVVVFDRVGYSRFDEITVRKFF